VSIEQQPQPATKPRKVKMNSRWRKGAQRYSTERTVEQTRFVKQPDGSRRRETDAVAEPRFVDRAHEVAGWRHGAKVRKQGV
jgi:hypothetical protein